MLQNYYSGLAAAGYMGQMGTMNPMAAAGLPGMNGVPAVPGLPGMSHGSMNGQQFPQMPSGGAYSNFYQMHHQGAGANQAAFNQMQQQYMAQQHAYFQNAQKNMMMASQQHYNNMRGQADAQAKAASTGAQGPHPDGIAGKQPQQSQAAGLQGKNPSMSQNPMPKISSHPEAPKNVNKLQQKQKEQAQQRKDAEIVRPLSCKLKGKAQFECKKDIITVDDRYTVQKLVGSGAYGHVFAAKDSKTGKRVAIKRINKAFEDVIDAKRVLREIKILSK